MTVWLSSVTVKKSEGSFGAQDPAVAVPAQPSVETSTETPPETCASRGLPVAGSQTSDPESEGPFVTPHVTAGLTELVSGFYVEAFGPAPRPLPEGCEAPAEQTGSGTVEVKSASGELVATQIAEEGHLAEIPLPAGSYTVVATFTGVKADGEYPEETESVVIPPGDTVRKDFLIELT